MRVLRIGDRVRFDGGEHQVAALDGTLVRLAGDVGAQVVLLSHLVAAADFELLDAIEPVAGAVVDLLEDVPAVLAERARAWEWHIVEMETGLPPDAAPGAGPRPPYRPEVRLGERENAKALELTVLFGQPISVRTVQRMRLRYRQYGARGLIDGRALVRRGLTGRADPRLVEAVRDATGTETGRSSGTRDRLRRRVEWMLAERYGTDGPAIPSKSAFNRLLARLDTGGHTFGAATTRRSLAAKPDSPYTVTFAARPGQHVHIDSTPLDVLAVFDDGIGRRRAALCEHPESGARTVHTGGDVPGVHRPGHRPGDPPWTGAARHAARRGGDVHDVSWKVRLITSSCCSRVRRVKWTA